MTAQIDNQERLDRMARALHTEAVAQVSPHTLARLRPRPRGESTHRGWWGALPGWSLATACAAVFIVALGMRTLVAPGPVDADPAPAVASAPAAPAEAEPFAPYEDALIAFDEDPDLFVWLAME